MFKNTVFNLKKKKVKQFIFSTAHFKIKRATLYLLREKCIANNYL